MSLKYVYETNTETINKGIDTLELLSEQRDKLNKINKETDEIDNNISYSQYILNKMSSFFFNIKTKIYSEKLDIQEKPDIQEHPEYDKINCRIKKDNLLNNDNKLSIQLKSLKNINILIGDEIDNQQGIIQKINLKVDKSSDEIYNINKQIKSFT